MHKEIRIDPPGKGGEPVILPEDPGDVDLSRFWHRLCRQHYLCADGDINEAKTTLRQLLKRRKDLTKLLVPVWLDDSMQNVFPKIAHSCRKAMHRVVMEQKAGNGGAAVESVRKSAVPEGDTKNESYNVVAEGNSESGQRDGPKWEPPKDGAAGIGGNRTHQIFRQLWMPYLNTQYGLTTLAQLKQFRSTAASHTKTTVGYEAWATELIQIMKEGGATDQGIVEEYVTPLTALRLFKTYNRGSS